MPGHRIERLTSLLTQEITLLLQNEIKDPRVIGVNSVTSLKLAKDLKSVIVFISSMNEKEKLPEIIEGLNSSAHYIRKRLGKILTLKFIPKITFKLDDSIEKGTDLYFKLKNMEKEERELGWYDDENEGKKE